MIVSIGIRLGYRALSCAVTFLSLTRPLSIPLFLAHGLRYRAAVRACEISLTCARTHAHRMRAVSHYRT